MRSGRLSVLLAGMAVLVTASCAYGGIVFQDDFSGDLSKWSFLLPFGNPAWEIENGWAKAPSGGWARAIVGGSMLSLKDFRMEADMRRTEASPGLFAHAADDWRHNLMFVNWKLAPPNDVWSSRIWIQSGDDTGYVKYAQTLTPDLDLTDCHIVISYINDVATCTISDYYGHSYTATGAVGPAEGLQDAGFLGLMAEGLTYYDNVVIEAIPEPGSLVALAGGLLGLAGLAMRRRA